MSQHRLRNGKLIIDWVTSLGRALGYSVRAEMPVEDRPKAPAVDVAWFTEGEQKYPLMIFEIESKATNAMANNPAKVFGQPSGQFERPLFFFHIIVSSGRETSRIKHLEGVFGSHNYRVYSLDKNMATQLVKDILGQHRRIRSQIDVGAFSRALIASPSLSAETGEVLDQAAELGFHGSYLHDLAKWGAMDPERKGLFLRHLRERQIQGRWRNTDAGYETWLGRDWSFPIHLGLLFVHSPQERVKIFEQLQWWQERSSYMSQIGPHFGLSREYDLFIMGAAGGLWAVVAALTVGDDRFAQYIAQQLVLIVKALGQKQSVAWLHPAVWGLHISASGRDEAVFGLLRAFVNERGGMPPQLLYHPPAVVAVDGDEEWRDATKQSAQPVPEFKEFIKRIAEHSCLEVAAGAVEIALAA
jgi:hypothetical protein